MAKRRGLQQYASVSYLTSELIVKNVLFVLFLGLLAVFYIANVHQAERNVRQIQELQKEIRELRWYYMSLQAENMYNSKQSEIAEQVAPLGLHPQRAKPRKIVVKE
jgi:cell division protein FtsL